MKAMKAMKATKAMKAMKKKTISKVAKGKYRKAVVFKGGKEKTSGGMTKSDIIKNKAGRFVSKKASAAAKKRFSRTIKGWLDAVQKARKELGLKGFVPIKKGSAIYK